MTSQTVPSQIKQQTECGTTQPMSPSVLRIVKREKKMDKKIAEKAKEAKKSTSIGSSRGIESMFRSAYRTQLDMLALAATKANIMISLNGLLVSILLVSGTYLLEVEPLLIIPFVAFLITCVTAIVFAVLAARPSIDRKKHTLGDFRNDTADLLVFNQFAALDRDDYLDAMQEMAHDNDRIYNNMIVHIYGMGQTANQKFTQLYYSYSAFMIGIVISMSLLLIVIARAVLIGV